MLERMIYSSSGHKTCNINKWSVCIVYMLLAWMLIYISLAVLPLGRYRRAEVLLLNQSANIKFAQRFKSVALVAGFVSTFFRGMNLQTVYLWAFASSWIRSKANAHERWNMFLFITSRCRTADERRRKNVEMRNVGWCETGCELDMSRCKCNLFIISNRPISLLDLVYQISRSGLGTECAGVSVAMDICFRAFLRSFERASFSSSFFYWVCHFHPLVMLRLDLIVGSIQYNVRSTLKSFQKSKYISNMIMIISKILCRF